MIYRVSVSNNDLFRYLHHTIHLLSEDDRSCLSIDIPVPPSQPLFDPNRSVVRSLALRRGPDDMGRISQSLSLRISPPPSSSVCPPQPPCHCRIEVLTLP